jgi:hypothetical protein
MPNITVCTVCAYPLSNDYANSFFQLESSSFALDGHRDSVNAVKFDADLSMLLSGGKLFLPALISSLLTLVSRQLWSYNRMGLGNA